MRLVRRRLRIRNLERKTVFALLLPLFGPSFVHGAFGIVGSGFGVGKFDRINAAEILQLIARRFDPNVFYTGNLASHATDAVDGGLAVSVGNGVPEFVNDDMQYSFGLPKPVLCRDSACMDAAPAMNIARPRMICAAYFFADVMLFSSSDHRQCMRGVVCGANRQH